MDKTLKTVDKLLRKSSLKLAVTNDGIKVLTAEEDLSSKVCKLICFFRRS